MIEDLAYGDPFEQRVAAWALGEIGHPAAIPVLVEALENDIIRTIVQKALIKIGSPAIPEMVQLLDEEEFETHWELRSIIAQTLLAIGDPAAVEYLLESLYDSEYEVRWSAANAISGFGEVAVAGLLEIVFEAESLEDEDGDICHAAASALVWIGSQTAIEGLLNALRDVDANRRAVVAESLAEATHPLVVPALIERLNDADFAEWDDEENIAEIAAMSLERIGTSEAIAAVEKWRRENG
jgi:HEAT repeat protein